MTERSKAVFLSYASQDAEAARRICDALRAADIEVWFDQSELRGGDAWDRQIRKQIHDCALFVPIISAHAQMRLEGYFRREWKLAADRTHDMAEEKAFLVPVVIDDTSERYASVPDKFHEVQWSRLPEGKTSPAFIEHVSRLLSLEPFYAPAEARSPAAAAPHTGAAPRQHAPIPRASRQTQPLLLLIVAVAVIVIGYLAVDRLVLSQRVAVLPTASTTTVSPAQTTIPEKSVAVLPFVNMSSDKEQEYFSDGLSEELIDMLSKVPDLRVPARTSSFFFKGKNETLETIAKQLKVANLLEGSVRKAGDRLRVTAQLVRADSGYHLWSETYDRAAKDIFNVQDEISTAVVTALKVKLVAGAVLSKVRGTTNTEAYNQYLIAQHFHSLVTLDGYRRAIAAARKALALDPDYADARAQLALAEAYVADFTGDSAGLEQAIADINQAVVRNPSHEASYRVRGAVRAAWQWDWAGAKADFEKARALDPTDWAAEYDYAILLGDLGQFAEAISVGQSALVLDPLGVDVLTEVARNQVALRDLAGAEVTLNRALEIDPAGQFPLKTLSGLRLLQGRAAEALDVCSKISDERYKVPCVAMAEYSAGHTAAARSALEDELQKGVTSNAYAIAKTFAWRGETDKAFEWLDKAYQRRDSAIIGILGDRIMDSLHPDPRYGALLARMNLPR